MKIISAYGPTKTVSRKVDEETGKNIQGLGEPTLNLLEKKMYKQSRGQEHPRIVLRKLHEESFTPPLKK